MDINSSDDYTLQHVTCTLETANPIVGDSPLSWSEDNWIAVATSENVITYGLNPLKDAGCPNTLFEVQVIPCPIGMGRNAGIKDILEKYDSARSLAQRAAVTPDFEIFRTHLNPSLSQIVAPDVKNGGVKAVSFSPLYCAPRDGSVLGILFVNHCFQLFIRSSDGTMIQWTKALDLTDILVKRLMENNGYYPNVKFPTFSSPLKAACEKQCAASINNFAWGSRKCRRNGEKFVHIATSSKNDYILIWRLGLPICATSEATILSYIKAFDEGVVKSLTFMQTESNETNVVAGNDDGRVVCLQLANDGSLIQRSEIWSEKDELAVSNINWQRRTEYDGDDCVVLLFAKGSFVVHITLASDFNILSYSVLKDVHFLPVVNIACLGEGKWISASRDGVVAKIALDSSDTGNDQLQSEVLSNADNVTTLFHEVTHYLRISPNKAFVAILRSKPKVSRSVMAKNSSYLDIQTLMTGMKSFESLCLAQEEDVNDFPKLDLLECIRQHLIHQEFASNDTENSLKISVGHFVASDRELSPLKWCLAKICAKNFATVAMCGNIFHKLEKEVVIAQMIKVLEWWRAGGGHRTSQRLPIRGIVKFLQTNGELLSGQHRKLLESIEKSEIYRKAKDEVCAVTGEVLTFSDDAKHAITEKSRVQWFRCCLTFCAIQGLKYRKCVVSNARALLDEDSKMQELLLGRSIYSGLPMI